MKHATAPHRPSPAIGPLPGPEASPDELSAHLQRLLEARRERVATAALQGLLASCGHLTRNAPSAELLASRSVRYADALLAALNHATAEAIHARPR